VLLTSERIKEEIVVAGRQFKCFSVYGSCNEETLGFHVGILNEILNIAFRLGPVWCPVQNKRFAPLSFYHGCRKRVTTLTTEMDCDQTAMGLLLVTSTVFFIVKSFWYNGLGGMIEMFLLSLRG
jgi:hypothetical protein